MIRTSRDEKFVAYLESLREDRAALAALRRGMGQPPGTEPQMYPYVEPWLPESSRGWLEGAYYLTAALFAYHPAEGGQGNMGNHFARVRATEADDTALERRFVTLLAAHLEDLQRFHLRQAVSFLKSKEAPINWLQLLKDLQGWDYSDRPVQQRWARAFWARPVVEPENQSSNDEIV